MDRWYFVYNVLIIDSRSFHVIWLKLDPCEFDTFRGGIRVVRLSLPFCHPFDFDIIIFPFYPHFFGLLCLLNPLLTSMASSDEYEVPTSPAAPSTPTSGNFDSWTPSGSPQRTPRRQESTEVVPSNQPFRQHVFKRSAQDMTQYAEHVARNTRLKTEARKDLLEFSKAITSDWNGKRSY